MVSAKRSGIASAPLHYYRRRPRVSSTSRRHPSPSPSSTSMAAAPHPLAALWAQATAIQSIKSLIPVTLDLKASDYSKWHNFLLIAVTQYGLADHLDAVPPPADDAEWQRMDSTVLRWLYGSISPEITDMVMMATTTAAAVLTRITALFRDNQQARAGYLSQKFRNIVQGDKTITAYCLEQKTVADALADVGAPVTDDALVWNIIKGLDEKYEDVGNLVPLLKPFPSFLEFRNMLLLQELKPSNARSSAPAPPTAFYSAPPAGGPRGPLSPPAGYGAPAASGRNKGKKKTAAAAPFPSLQHPWTGAIHMYPMAGPGYGHHAGLLGPRPHAAPTPRPYMPAPRPPAHGYTAMPMSPAHATASYAAYSPYGAASAPTWDPSALANYFNTMSLQPPTEWTMDTGASAHMSSDAGPQDRGHDSQVQ